MLKAEYLAAAEWRSTTRSSSLPDDDRTKNLLGLVRFRAGRTTTPTVYRELVSTHAPTISPIRFNLGLVELRMAKHSDAADDLRWVVEQEPKNIKAQGYYGLALMRPAIWAARDAFLAAGQAEFARQVMRSARRASEAGRRQSETDGRGRYRREHRQSRSPMAPTTSKPPGAGSSSAAAIEIAPSGVL